MPIHERCVGAHLTGKHSAQGLEKAEEHCRVDPVGESAGPDAAEEGLGTAVRVDSLCSRDLRNSRKNKSVPRVLPLVLPRC